VSSKREPRELSPNEFKRRVFAFARKRYGIKLPDNWINELIRNDLIEVADREPNQGLHPIYRLDYRAYRRALQIARLRRDEIVEIDAIRLQMFVRGYGNIKDIREPLANQYVRIGKGLIAQVRSGYADNWRSVPDGHKRSILKQMEPLDAELDAAGFRLPDDTYIQALRSAKQVPIHIGTLDIDALFRGRAVSSPLFQSMAPLLLELLNGLLMFGDSQTKHSSEIDDIEQLIRQASDEEYSQATEFYRIGVTGISLGLIPTERDAETRREACRKLAYAIKNDHKWTVALLALGLLIARKFNIDLTHDNFRDLQRQIAEHGSTFEQLLEMAILGRS
jgi:hypothetical protein